VKNKKLNLQPGVLWITGLSGSGKTTISKILLAKLKKKYDNIILLDGDKLRKTLKIKKKGTFNYNQRKKMGLIYAKICKSYLKKDYFVIISVMALIKFVHQWNKKNLINYKDVYLKVPLYILKKRDPKKIYEKFRLKKIKNVAGLDLKYDVPKKPSLQIIWNKKLTPQKITNKIIKKLF
tara:strand:- start:8951 stop:9487 length:537 start_codon:yes stop_codon:yes gene_type:complete